MERNEYHTLKGYQMDKADSLTESMEDYLEMIARTLQDGETVGVNQLAARLHVRPSSASKMVGKLKDAGFVRFERYGKITLTQQGAEAGRYLLWRHDTLHRFFCLLNHSKDELKQVELIEHFMSAASLANIEKLIPFLLSRDGEGASKTM